MTDPTEHPIIFGRPAVRAIVDGRKTSHRVLAADPDGKPRLSPFGRAGDRLWLREDFSTRRDGEAIKIRYPADGPGGPARFVPIDQAGGKYATVGYVTRPARYMPRWASRIVLAVLAVHREQLRQLTEAAAQAEGFCDVAAFQSYWDAAHAAAGSGWLTDPPVHVVRFSVLEPKGVPPDN